MVVLLGFILTAAMVVFLCCCSFRFLGLAVVYYRSFMDLKLVQKGLVSCIIGPLGRCSLGHIGKAPVNLFNCLLSLLFIVVGNSSIVCWGLENYLQIYQKLWPGFLYLWCFHSSGSQQVACLVVLSFSGMLHSSSKTMAGL